ncbi:MAG: hypothetical protein L7F78_17890, partial [Syntrophales bacterium LBB04]|nr:hypothetical protein [Syntrophales bacterium LBB04]
EMDESASLRNLINRLVIEYEKFQERSTKNEIIKAIYGFNIGFWLVAKAARYAGVQERQIRKIWRTWRGKFVSRLFRDDVPPSWKEEWGDYEEPLAIRLSIPLNAITSFKAPPARIAHWVNIILKALGEPAVSDRTLRDRIAQIQKDMLSLISKHNSPTE